MWKIFIQGYILSTAGDTLSTSVNRIQKRAAEQQVIFLLVSALSRGSATIELPTSPLSQTILFCFFFPILRYKIYFTKISRNLDKLVKFTVDFFSPKNLPNYFGKKSDKFCQKNHWGSSTKPKWFNVFFQKQTKKGHLWVQPKKTAKCVSIEKLKGKKEKKERSKNTPQIWPTNNTIFPFSFWNVQKLERFFHVDRAHCGISQN